MSIINFDFTALSNSVIGVFQNNLNELLGSTLPILMTINFAYMAGAKKSFTDIAEGVLKGELSYEDAKDKILDMGMIFKNCFKSDEQIVYSAAEAAIDTAVASLINILQGALMTLKIANTNQ